MLGALLVRQQKLREAIKVLDACDPHHPLTRYYMAVALSQLGEEDDACAKFLEALYREDPSSLRQRLLELVKQMVTLPPTHRETPQ